MALAVMPNGCWHDSNDGTPGSFPSVALAVMPNGCWHLYGIHGVGKSTFGGAGGDA